MIFLSVKKHAFMSDILHIFVLINVGKRINGRKRSDLFTIKIPRYYQIIYLIWKKYFLSLSLQCFANRIFYCNF